MTSSWHLPTVHEAAITPLAGLVAFALRPGDMVALSGDLGAGKTTFARALIRALLSDPMAEVPSPTFSLVQTYETPRFPLAHADLYRLSEAAELAELGIDETLRKGVALIEWPERAGATLPPDRLEITFREMADEPNARGLRLQAFGHWQPRLARLQAIERFLYRAAWPDADIRYLQGDASPRRYARLLRSRHSLDPDASPTSALLMDSPRQPDGPPIRDGLPYSRIAHLAEDVLPFVAVADALRAAGLSAPQIHVADLTAGLLLIEDLGDRVFGTELAAGGSQDLLWHAATEALLALRAVPVPAALPLPGGEHRLPDYDRRALGIETEVMLDWYWPALLGAPATAAARAHYARIWSGHFDRLLALPKGWVLRDYHSPNLIWLPDRHGVARVGIIDFQDAMAGHAAYDLVSLLQDARLDVPAALERQLLGHYCDRAAAREPDFSAADFRFAHALLGAQRNTKILGIFARLAQRDGKPQYLRHIPRIWGYLERNLAAPELADLRAWYDEHLPPGLRQRPLSSPR